MKDKEIKVLNSGLPRWLIETAFVLMIASAICSWHDFQMWFNANCPIALALAQNAGMLVMYFAVMKGMAPLRHPLTGLWATVSVLCLAGFVTVALGPAYGLYNFYVASLLALAYLPLGTLLIVWYPGRLRTLGAWMILRILVMTLIPVLLYVVLDVKTDTTFDLAFEVACLFVEIAYAYLLRRVVR